MDKRIDKRIDTTKLTSDMDKRIDTTELTDQELDNVSAGTGTSKKGTRGGIRTV